MPLLLSLLEPEALPARLEASVDAGQEVRVYALAPELAWAGLRATVMRAGDALAPPGSLYACTVLIREDHRGRPSLRLLAIGADVEIEKVHDHGAAGLSAPCDLDPEGWLALTLPTLRRVQLGLRVRAELVVGAAATVGGSGTARSQIVRGEKGALWLVPTVWRVFGDQMGWVEDNLRGLGKRWGLSAQSIQTMMIVATFVAVAAVGLWQQRGAMQEAEAKAETAAEAQARADDARDAALQAEMSCIAERRELIDRLGEVDEARRLQAERALASSAARALARAEGGVRMGDDALLTADEAIMAANRAAVSARVAEVEALPEAARPCLDQAPALGDDLPRYALLWHPDPDVFCPPDYAGVLDGLTLVGRWGLSPRVARQYGAASPAPAGAPAAPPDGAPVADLRADPRASDRWSADTLADGLRDVQRGMLTWGDPARAPVWPGEAQLWSLALFHATNRLPRAADGALDRPHRVCVDALLADIAEQRGPVGPHDPVLPALLDVAEGRVVLKPRATPGCPWPADAMAVAAEAALQAAARLAAVDEGPPVGP
jgi:hypothetical protein